MSDLGVKICGCIHAVPTNHSKSVTQWFECRNRACRNEGRPADPVTCELCPMRDSGDDVNKRIDFKIDRQLHRMDKEGSDDPGTGQN